MTHGSCLPPAALPAPGHTCGTSCRQPPGDTGVSGASFPLPGCYGLNPPPSNPGDITIAAFRQQTPSLSPGRGKANLVPPETETLRRGEISGGFPTFWGLWRSARWLGTTAGCCHRPTGRWVPTPGGVFTPTGTNRGGWGCRVGAGAGRCCAGRGRHGQTDNVAKQPRAGNRTAAREHRRPGCPGTGVPLTPLAGRSAFGCWRGPAPHVFP